jgi:LL-diaminopimelate aminotransferase
MSDPYIQNLFAERIGGAKYGKGTEIYKFERIKRAKRAALAAHPGVELIDMGVGEPDAPAFPQSIDALCAAARDPENRGYADNGGMPYKEAAARWMKNVCGVEGIDPATQVVHSIGSKAALTLFPACFINPGDVALMTTPGYPVFGTHAKYYGGEAHNLPLQEKNNFLPDLSSIPADKLKRAKTLVLNYPNNPTGASATPQFFADVVAFARKHNIVVFHDAAYAALVFEGKPLSFLATPGAVDVGVELHSMSKGFNMTGWRLGFVVGNPLIVKAYADVKDRRAPTRLITRRSPNRSPPSTRDAWTAWSQCSTNTAWRRANPKARSSSTSAPPRPPQLPAASGPPSRRLNPSANGSSPKS